MWDEMLTEFKDAKDGLWILAICGSSEEDLESKGLLTPAFARKVPRQSFLGGSEGRMLVSFGGVSRYVGVVANEE